MAAKIETLIKSPEKFTELTELLSLFTEASNRLAQLETTVNESFFGILGEFKADYALIQQTLTEAESQVKAIAQAHPEWFSAKATLKTPYGSVRHTSGTKLECANEEMAITLIEREGEIDPLFKPQDFIRQHKELNREALENLPNDKLARFCVKRTKTEDFKVTAAKVDLGKAVEEAVKKAIKAAA